MESILNSTVIEMEEGIEGINGDKIKERNILNSIDCYKSNFKF